MLKHQKKLDSDCIEYGVDLLAQVAEAHSLLRSHMRFDWDYTCITLHLFQLCLLGVLALSSCQLPS